MRRSRPFKRRVNKRKCPIDFDALKPILENKFGIEVVLGTHTY